MKLDLSVDEIVGVLNRTSLPTVVVEGDHDIILYRTLEERLADLGASLLPAGGRDNLLQVLSRRTEFSAANVAFLADSDLWIFTNAPTEFASTSLILTDGYSIENDLYRDGNLESMMSTAELARFRIETDSVIEWYAGAIHQLSNGAEVKLDVHPNAILDNAGQLIPTIKSAATTMNAPAPLLAQIKTDYAKFLRGKTLVALLARQLAHSARQPKHKKLALLEMAACRHGPFLQRLEREVRTALV